MRDLIVTLVLVIAIAGLAAEWQPTAPAPLQTERWYQERIAEALAGKMEVAVPNGRVDILTETHAIEVEFASAWKHAIGQALWYGLQTNKTPGIVLVIRDEIKDRPHVVRLGSVIEANGLAIKVWLWPDDFR